MGDVTKQFLYEQVLAPKTDGHEVYNLFFFPGDIENDWFQILAAVEMGLFHPKRLLSVSVSCQYVFDIYVNSLMLSERNVVDLTNEIEGY